MKALHQTDVPKEKVILPTGQASFDNACAIASDGKSGISCSDGVSFLLRDERALLKEAHTVDQVHCSAIVYNSAFGEVG